MCKCCKCCCDPIVESPEQVLDRMLSINEQESKERTIRRDYVQRNIPFIIDLVWRYNEEVSRRPESAKEGRDQADLLHSFAEQIIRYVK